MLNQLTKNAVVLKLIATSYAEVGASSCVIHALLLLLLKMTNKAVSIDHRMALLRV